MSSSVGYIAALISMVGWGSYFVPMKRIKNYDPVYFQAVMCMGIFISSIILSIFIHEFLLSILGILSGILWSIGNSLSVVSIKHSKLSIAAPIWMGIAIFGSFISGTFFLKETIHSLPVGIFGLILLVIGIFLMSSVSDNKKGSADLKGIVFAVFAGFLFGLYLIPFKLSHISPLPFLFSMSLGIMIWGLILFLFKRPKIEQYMIVPGILSGIIWNIANVSSFFAVGILGIAIGFPLTQMALFVSVLWGLFYFGEIKGKSRIFKLIFAAVILFVGSLLLSFSK